MNGRIVIRPTDTIGFRCPLCDKKVEIPLLERLHKDTYVCPKCKQMVAQLVQQNNQAPNAEVTNILNMIVPLMQSVNGMVQPQQPPAKR